MKTLVLSFGGRDGLLEIAGSDAEHGLGVSEVGEVADAKLGDGGVALALRRAETCQRASAAATRAMTPTA